MQESSNIMDTKIGLCGFRNIGNTCYMNSIIQLLIHSKNLVKFLLNNDDKAEYEDYLNEAIIDNLANKERKRLCLDSSSRVTIDRKDIDHLTKTAITTQLSEIINAIIKKGNSIITPVSLKKAIDNKLPSFRGMYQQDSHELLIQLLDCIVDETGIESEPEINNVPESINKYLRLLEQVKLMTRQTSDIEEKKSIISKFNEYRKENKLIINNYLGLTHMLKYFKEKYNPFIYQFMGFAINKIECENCKNINTNFENISVLSLNIKSSLKECLDNFTEPEKINDYNCSICQSSQIAYKTTKIWRNPYVLFIHLKRFRVVGIGRTLKDNTVVDIPHELNLTDYCDDSLCTEKSINPIYKLKGISNHHGGMGGGHYTADCECIVNKDVWYNFDDSNVSRYQNKNINMSSAYVLMYELKL
jgi:ubiquitin carboxyl-terminal hydrolase 8